MKRISTLILKTAVIFVSLTLFFGLAWFPQTEGRAANLSIIQIYRDPFIIYIYVASIFLFGIFYQAFKLLGYIGRDNIPSQLSMRALRNIKYYAGIFITFIAAAVAYIFIFQRSKSDDIAGGVMMGLFVISASLIVIAGAILFERHLKQSKATN